MADKLISKIPDGPLAEKWTKRKSELRLVNPNNRRKLESSLSVPDLAALPQPLLSVSLATMSRFSASVTHLAARTPSPPRVVSMPLRTIRMTMTLSIVSSTTRSKEVTTAAVRRMSIVSPRSARPLSTSASPRVFLSPVSTAATWPTVRSEVFR